MDAGDREAGTQGQSLPPPGHLTSLGLSHYSAHLLRLLRGLMKEQGQAHTHRGLVLNGGHGHHLQK